MLIQNKKIAIIGGGPGGLTLARLLQIQGADVKVYERDLNRDVRVQGATLDLHQESGLMAIKKAGLIEAFEANYRPGADKIRITDHNATIYYDQHTETSTESFSDVYFRPEIDRGPLRDILLNSLQPDTVVWNSQFLSMSPVDDHWKLEFQNATATADIVIGADGANSKVRPFITPIKPFYSGVTVIEGTVYDSKKTTPRIHEFLKGGKIFAMGGEKTLIVSSKGDGSLAFYTGCKTDEFWVRNSGIDFKDKSQLLAWFKREFADWDIVWHELFDNDKSYFIPRPQYCMPLDQIWEAKENITLLGDAAHLMPPYAGEGVNMAMLDAVMLSECLTNNKFDDTRSAIAQYEKEMRARASDIAKITLEQTESLHSANAISNMMAMFAQ
ncbi:FAD-dependent oxidoreductase [Ohtaekwangia koreensis]|uniref:Flavin-dependent monooxygenase n=1 Tax=Ohtaekwangia koreensis TaxID=688867 RepID=A0A1T5MFF0_9BACT|nr:NAD(P)/FAD-dependent oxidoreductase [Ohtaekwangia koreensis]SKC86922.1 2-polyprenyl-6-methoxyphenol hydroxylase [Ohtaekwangia koreensis]